jgi:xylitol oxidase
MMRAEKITNWAGNLIYSTTALHEPMSEDELRSWVGRQDRFKVLGTRHCFNDIADSGDGFLSLAGLNKTVALDKAASTVTVGGGMRYGEVAVFLHENGYALHNLASLPHISVAGGCATATHGSGVHNRALSGAVVGMEFVTAAGETVWLSRHRDGTRFAGAVVHLGGIGVVTKLELTVEPAYEVRQYVYENLPLEALQEHFDAIMSAGYSVSLFTDWCDRTINEVWVKSRVGGVDGFGAPAEFFGARAAVKNLHPIRDITADNCTPQLGVQGPWHERLPHFKMGFTPSSG